MTNVVTRQTFDEVGIMLPPGATGEIDTTCPVCSPKRQKSREKCLSVNVERGFWFCHHCPNTGHLAGYTAGDTLREPQARTYQKPRPPADADLPDHVVRWFASRGIPDWVLAERRITAGPEFSPNKGASVPAIRFPYYRTDENGEEILVNIKYRGPEKDFWMAKGAERILFGLDLARGADTVVIVEGEMDALTIDAVNGPVAISVPDGAPTTNTRNYASKFAFLASAEAILRDVRRVIIAVDMDEPGLKLADELARRIGIEKCQRVTWPPDCKDANETLLKRGPTGVLDALADAQPYPVAGIATVRDLAQRLETLYESGFNRGDAVGWQTFDQHLRFRPGALTIWTGSPGAGKSAFLDNILVRLAWRHGWSVGICSPENQPLERHLASILSIATEKPFTDGPTPRMTPDEMRTARLWAESRFAFIMPDEPTVDSVLERTKLLVYRHGIRAVVIDPWNELDHSRPGGMSETEYISNALTQLRNFARAHQVEVHLVAHPTKLSKSADGTYPVPTLYDIAGSAHFANKADRGVAVWRDLTEDSGETQVHIQKVRFSETGRLGVVSFRFNIATSVFEELY